LKQAQPPDFSPEPGWEPLEMPRSFGSGRSFVSGEPAGDRLRVHYFRRISDGMFVAKAWFGPGAEGPPGHAHGGSMAAVLDEVMGFACWVAGHPVVAATITVNFMKRLPLEQVFVAEAYVTGVEGQKVFASGRLYDPASGVEFSNGTGLFIQQPLESFGNAAAFYGGHSEEP